MVGFGYKNPLAGKSFSFGSAFGNSPTLNQDPARGLTGVESYFDTQNVYGGDRRLRDKAVGRMVAGNMGAVLTDQQLQNLGSGISAIKDMVNLQSNVGGHVGSLNNQGALTDDRVNQYLQGGDLLGATGFGGMDAGSAFGTLKANAQAAQAAGDTQAYSAYTNPANFYGLSDLAARTMGGVGLSMFGQAMDDADIAYRLGQDPFDGAGDMFGQGQTAQYGHTSHTPVTPEPIPTTPDTGGNAPSDTDDDDVVGNNGGSAFGNAGGTMPPGGMGLDDLNTRIQALEGAFFEAQGTRADPAQLNYLTRMANDQGLEAAVNFAKNNIIVKAVKASGQTAPKITNSQDVNGASALYDFVNRFVPGAITQDKSTYVSNLLAWYAQNGM